MKLRTWIMILVIAGAATAMSDDDQQVFPSRMRATPNSNQEAPAHVVGVPNRTGEPGAALSPDQSSQMGFGIQIPFGSPPKAVPQNNPQLKSKKKSTDSDLDEDSGD